MTFPEKVSLKKAGESITLTVQKCAPATVGTYPEIEFVGIADGRLVVVPVPKVSADRQLARLLFNYEDCVKATLTISRDPNAKDANKPYWGITLAQGNGSAPVRADSAPQPTAASVTPGVPDGGKPETPRDIYMAITKDTLAHVVPLYLDAGVEVDASAVAAIVATRFIAATRNGH